MKILVIQTNSTGRPCAWGIADTKTQATAEALGQWEAHSCFAGEKKGDLIVHVQDDPEDE